MRQLLRNSRTSMKEMLKKVKRNIECFSSKSKRGRNRGNIFE